MSKKKKFTVVIQTTYEIEAPDENTAVMVAFCAAGTRNSKSILGGKFTMLGMEINARGSTRISCDPILSAGEVIAKMKEESK